MVDNQSLRASRLRYFHEALFALNIALATMDVIFLYNEPLMRRFFRADVAINQLLHIRQTDLVFGYWAVFLPGIALALCIWLFLCLFRRSSLTNEILHSFAGIAAFTAFPVCWLMINYESNHRYGWVPFRSIQFYEVLLVLTLLSIALYLEPRRSVPLWASFSATLIHYGYWFWQFGTYSLFFANNGPFILVPIAGFLSAVIWLLYERWAQPRTRGRASI